MGVSIAVLSDIHGNYTALEKCLEYISERNIKTLFFLGDYAGELAYPERTMQLIYELKNTYDCYFIKGNKEGYWQDYLAHGEEGWEFGNSATGSLLYTYHSLTKKDMEFFRQLGIFQKVQIEDFPTLMLCHGSPEKVDQQLLPDKKETLEVMERSETSIILCGHTHRQGKIAYQGKMILNPGSVGMSLSCDGKTQFLLLHGRDENWVEEFISLNYDFEKVIRDLYEVGLDQFAPYWCRITEEVLRGSRISHGRVIGRAMKLCEEENGVCKWPHIPAKYWELAIEELI